MHRAAESQHGTGAATEAVTRREVRGFVVSEFVIRGPALLAPHAHPYANLGLLFLGGYTLEGDGPPIEVWAPMIAYLPAGVRRAVTFPPGESQFLWLELPDHLTAELASARAEPGSFVPLTAPRGQWLANHLSTELRRDDRASAHLVHGMLLELVGSLLRSLEAPETPVPAWLPVAMAAFHDPSAKVRIRKVASRCGVHPSHFTRSFRRHVGCAPREYLRLQRVARARLLVTRSELPLVEIAAECGFADQAHLTREFKRLVGSSPARFRREMAERQAGSKRVLPRKTWGREDR